MINQYISNTPPKRVQLRNKTYRFIKQCNPNLFLYQEENNKYNTTFSSFDLGMISAPDVKPERKPHTTYRR